MILKFLRKYAFFSTLLGSFLLIIFLAISRFNILPFLQNHMGEIGKILFDYISKNDLVYTVNSSVIIAISNLLLYILSSSPIFELSVKNSNLKSDFTELPLATSQYHRHVPKSFYFHIKVDYKNTMSYFIYRALGGISLEITYPSWIDATEDSEFWNTSQFINNNVRETISVDLYNAFPKERLKELKGEIYCKFDLITNLDLTSYDECFIEASLKPQSKKFLKKVFCQLFIWLLYDLSYDRHNIKTSN